MLFRVGSETNICKLFSNCKIKSAAFSRFRLDPDSAPVPFDDLLADREPDARTRILFPMVQPLEDDKYLPEVLRSEPDAIIADGKLPVSRFIVAGNSDPWRYAGTVVLDRIANQVLENLGNGNSAGVDHGE